MDPKKLREILKVVAESDVAEVEIEEDGFKVVIRKDTPSVTLQAPYPPPAYYAQVGAGPPQVAPGPVGPSAIANQSLTTPDSETPAASAQESVVKAPIVGTFYAAASPDVDPYVSVGTKVEEGAVLCIIEAMKLMNEIECEVSGTIKEMLVRDGDPVEYDQPLFIIEKA